MNVAHQAPLSMGFSRQEYWNGLPFPSLGDLPDPGMEPRSPAFQVDALPSEPPAATAAKSLQSCPTLCDPRDGSPPGSPSLGFSRQEYWSGLPFPSPGDLPDPGIEPESPALGADALPSTPPGEPKKEKMYRRKNMSMWELSVPVFDYRRVNTPI